jgi:hypothetical protein
MSNTCKHALIVCLAVTLSIGAAPPQSTPLKRVMRTKLEHSQGALEALVTSDWPALETHAVAMGQLPTDPRWAALSTPEYVRYTRDFVSAAQSLVEAAQRRDLDAAPIAYVTMTLSCVQCHRYVARSRVATRD